MSIEAMWTVRFGEHGVQPHHLNGGIVVFETERLFGGDSIYAYVGTYRIEGQVIIGNLDVFRHEPDLDYLSVYGTTEARFSCTFTGTIESDQNIAGTLGREGWPDGQIILRRVADLPG